MDSPSTRLRWGTRFEPDSLASLETRMWKAYYRRQPARLFGLLVLALREQAAVGWPRALVASLLLTRAAAGFARATDDYERFAPDIGRAYRLLGLPSTVDAEAVARHELRWWVVRREIGLAAGDAAGQEITSLYAEIYGVPRSVSRKPVGFEGWPPRSETGARPPTRTVRADRAARTGPRWRGCYGIPTARSTTPWASANVQAVVRTTADEPPGGREDAGRNEQLREVPDDEWRQAGGDRLRPGHARHDLEPRHADRVDHRAADEHRADRAADVAVPAELGEATDDRARDDEADEVAARGAPQDVDAALVLGEERQPDHARGARTTRRPRTRDAGPSAQPTNSTPNVWPVQGTGSWGITKSAVR